MHLSDSRQRNAIDVITCNYVFEWLHFKELQCMSPDPSSKGLGTGLLLHALYI